MFFSVLVPVYNTSEYLRECIDSIMSQSFADFELVLLDDGSTDRSGEICDEYASSCSNVRVIHKQNEGLMMTRRRGFCEAKGDYFICVDSDDRLYDKGALEKIHDTIIATGCDLVIYNYVYGEGGGRPQRTSSLLDYPTNHVFEGKEKSVLYNKLLTSNNMNNMWIKCPARHVVDIDVDYALWRDDICRAEDLFQSYPMLDNAGRVAYVEEPLYYYRWTAGSISNKPKFKYYNSLCCIYRRENEYMDKWGITPEVRDAAVRRQLTGLITVLCKCLPACRANGTVDEWKRLAEKMAEDIFFRDIMRGCRKENVLKYYRLLHRLICGKKFNAAIFVIEISEKLSSLKHGRRNNA